MAISWTVAFLCPWASEAQNKHNNNALAGIEPGSPAWEVRILPLNHQCCYREHICRDSLDGVLFRSFSSAGHSCPVLVGRSRLSSSALHSTGCPLPSGLLRVALAGTQVYFGSECWNRLLLVLTGPVLSKTLFDPLDCSPPGSSVLGISTLLC